MIITFLFDVLTTHNFEEVLRVSKCSFPFTPNFLCYTNQVVRIILFTFVYMNNKGFHGQTFSKNNTQIPTMFPNVVRLTLLDIYVASKTVIPAEAGIQKDKKTGFRVKPGMTIKVKRLMTHFTGIKIT